MTIKNKKPFVYDGKKDAIFTMYSQQDYILSSLIVLREYLDSKNFSKEHGKDAINNLIDSVINNQFQMMNTAKMDY